MSSNEPDNRFDFPATFRGDDFSGVRFTLQDGSGTPISLVNVTEIAMKVRKDKRTGRELHSATLGNGSKIEDAANGIFVIDPFSTDDFPVGSHHYDVELTDSQKGVLTVVYGEFPIVQDVTY